MKFKQQHTQTKTWKQQLAFGLCLIMLILSISACTNGDGDYNGYGDGSSISGQEEGLGNNGGHNGNGNNGSIGSGGNAGLPTGTGRFIETEQMVSDDMAWIQAMVELTDGTLRLIDAVGSIYDSGDGGTSWQLSDRQFDFLSPEAGEHLFAAALHPDGRAFISHERGLFYVSATGEVQQLEIELPILEFFQLREDQDDMMEMMMQRLFRVAFTSDGRILGTGMGADEVHLIDPASGEIQRSFGGSDDWLAHPDFIEKNNQLLALSTEGFLIYDLDTGHLVDLPAPLAEHFGGREFHMSGGFDRIRLFPARDSNAFYILESSGLYRYYFGASQMEWVINGALNHMSNLAYGFSTLVELENHRFLISYIGIDGNRLMDYTFSMTAEAVPSDELIVYSLFENGAVRQAISLFQSQNLHLLVQLEVGIEADDEVTTVSDAISALNTRIMAGSGPDVLILNGLPHEAYIANGILLELSEILQELKGEYDFFDNILTSLENNGEIHMVPTAFMALLTAGPEEVLGDMMELADLADLVGRLRQEDADVETILGLHDEDQILRLLIHHVYPRLLAADGTVNEEELREFLANVQGIHEANLRGGEIDIPELPYGSRFMMMATAEPSISMGVMDILDSKQQLSMGATDNVFGMNMLFSILPEVGWQYRMRNVFIPLDVVGINAMGNHLTDSKAFLAHLLSSEVQGSSHFGGIPVNRDGFLPRYEEAGVELGSFGVMREDGTSMIIDISGASVEQLDRFVAEIDQLDTPSMVNRIIMDAILSEAVPFLDGQQSLEEAVERILASVNLFLAE